MSCKRRSLIAVVAVLAVPMGTVRAAPKGEVQHKFAEKLVNGGDSLFQRALKQKVGERGEGRKPHTSYQPLAIEVVEDATGKGFGRPGACDGGDTPWRCPVDARVVKATATTFVTFDGPHQAHGETGNAPWPQLRVRHQKPVGDKDFAPDDGYDDYTAAYLAAAQEQIGGPLDCAQPDKVIWKGSCEDARVGVWEIGYEPRESEITEEVTFTFPEPAQAAAFARALSAAAPSAIGDILMGFTYDGPHIDYTIGDRRRACVPLLGCATIYDVRAGFALDFSAGLRLPVNDTLTVPAQLLAGAPSSFSSAINPMDWTVESYESVGVSGHDGNEFVVNLNFFAGAKVKILGADVCPWCQYVEINSPPEWSKSFTTPFGDGETADLPTIAAPLKTWDYDVVALTIGLTITPQFGSDRITAVPYAAGALTAGATRVDHLGPGVLAGVPVNGCIAAGTSPNPAGHPGSIILNDYKYWFTDFFLSIGAYIDLQVFGYGAWSGSKDLLSLDLASITGNPEIAIGAHTQCNWAFDCDQVGPASVSAALDVLDRSPPSTSAAFSGTAGTNGWYVSPVVATLSAADAPAGCGIGVAAGYPQYGINGGAMTAYAEPITLGSEGTTAVVYRAADADGNLEEPNAQSIRIDWTPPVVVGAPDRPANSNGWYREDVVVTFTAMDAVSLVASTTPPQRLSDHAAGQSVTGTAVDFAGNSASATVSGINIDRHPPVIVISSPQPLTYLNTDRFSFLWATTDSLSGVMSEGGTLDGTARPLGYTPDLLLFAGGMHEVTVTAIDRADNPSSVSVTFGLDITIDGLLASTVHVCELGWISKEGVCHSLQTKLSWAKQALAAGALTDARGQLGAFLNELDAQLYKAIIDVRAYDLLRGNAVYIMTRYGLSSGAGL